MTHMAPQRRRTWAGRARLAIGGAAVLAIGMAAGATLFPVARPEPPEPPAPIVATVSHQIDIAFSQDMIVHHQQAVDMSQTVRGRVSPQVAAIADPVTANELREIGQMQGWLAAWNAPQRAAGEPMAWVAAGGPPGLRRTGATAGSATVAMPGMASADDIAKLGRLTGEDLDVWYLQLMIRHHQGGIVMAAAAVRQAESTHVRTFASTIALDQQRESDTMTGLLTTRGRPMLAFP